MQLDPAQLAQTLNSLKKSIAGDVFLDEYHRALYSTDASMYQIAPRGVVVPRSVDDVRTAIEWASEQGIPLVPRGSGTSLSGQSIGPGIVLDFSKYMNAIIELNPDQMMARVQPGVVLDQLNAAAAGHELQFGPDVATSSRANLGGMIGNNSAGARSVRHGKMVDHVAELTALLADGSEITLRPSSPQQRENIVAGGGPLADIYRRVEQIVAENRDEIIKRFPRVLRRVSGYNLDEFVTECRDSMPRSPSARLVRERRAARDPAADMNLAHLVVGAEGTLACVTEALVELVPRPRVRAVLALHFESITDSVGSINRLLTFSPSAVELFDGMIVDMARGSLEYRSYLDFVVGNPKSLVLMELSGQSSSEVADAVERLQVELRDLPGLTHTLVALDPKQCEHIWACRKAALPLLMGVPGARKPIAFVEDTAIDPPRMPEFVERFREILTANDTDGAIYGHASVGCLHIRPMLDTRDREDVKRLKRISEDVCDLVIEFGGAMSGEHGDGIARSYLNERLFGPQLYQAFREVKAAFDPTNLMNPGKIVDAPGPTDHLRHPPTEKPLEVPTVLDFSDQGGLVAATSLCSGVGVCRKLGSGTMCPSFMATRDEEHSTRGRANALRLVLTGALPKEELVGKRLYDTYDLCLQCKGCKGECPSNVDVARLKSEFLHGYWQAHGTPLGVRAMGNIARLNRIGSAFAPLSNFIASSAPNRWLLEKLLGIDHRRSLPPFSRDTFRGWFTRREAGPRDVTQGDVVLLNDCLTSYSEPGVNRAAVEVLEAAGYRVHLADLPCCGRPMISKGLLPQAQGLAKSNIEKLLPYAKAGMPIVGCEPSCVLTLFDEYPQLVPGNDARVVASQSRLIETELQRSNAVLPVNEATAQVVLHGHCHQKALVGLADTQAMLAAIPGVEVKTLDSGCCGMAGSFGYEHYDLSMRIGERVLFPAVRQAPAAEIVAPGTSCRHQISDGTGRRAVHPIEFLARHLKPPTS